MRVLLIMRNTYGWNGDHIEALRQLGLDIHLATGVPDADRDPRFASVVPIPMELGLKEATEALVTAARQLEVHTVMTFYEADMVLTALVNAELGASWVRPEADITARDKRRQREFLAERGAPSARSVPVRSVEDGLAAAERLGYPIIVKPTFLSASIGVTLVADRTALQAALFDTGGLADSWESYFLARQGPAPDEHMALLEEFIPGKEVTVDGVVLFGRFYLSGVTDKMQMAGPYFEEDYYTLPHQSPEDEAELVELCQSIVDGLGVRHTLFNAEFRRDAAGAYRVIEFATRLSGGQNYRNLRDVYGLDPVRLFTKAILTDDETHTWAGELPRVAPRMTTCIKYVYRTGVLIRNNPGEAYHSPNFRSYYPAARPGARLRRPPEGWNQFAGSLSVGAPYREPADLGRVKQIATDLDQRLDVLVVSG